VVHHGVQSPLPACVCSSLHCPPVKFQPCPAPRCSIQASMSCHRIPSLAASPANRWQAALTPRRRVALLHRLTAVKGTTFPRCRRQTPSYKASWSASASSFLADTMCSPSSLELPSPVPHRHCALAHPCTPCGHGQHPPYPAHHPNVSERTKFPPLACPPRCPLLPTPPHCLCFSATPSVPSHLTPPLSPYAGAEASLSFGAASRTKNVTPSPPLSSGTIDRAGELLLPHRPPS
jgi:hypothetical protein